MSEYVCFGGVWGFTLAGRADGSNGVSGVKATAAAEKAACRAANMLK